MDNAVSGKIFTESEGPFPSLDYRVHFYVNPDRGERVHLSPWHDVPLKNPDGACPVFALPSLLAVSPLGQCRPRTSPGTFNFICEIPKWTRRKMEIATRELYNPIKQDTHTGKLREYLWGDMLFNYGAFPQTWEDPEHVTPDTGCKGDNDPLDAVEIGNKQWSTGSIVRVKVFACESSGVRIRAG